MPGGKKETGSLFRGNAPGSEPSGSTREKDSRSLSSQPIFCVGCGYDVRTLPVDGPCPECGTPIEQSLGGPRLAAADPRWLARLTLGQSLVAWGLYAALLAFCFLPLTAALFDLLAPPDSLVFDKVLPRITFVGLAVLFVVGAALCWVGALLVTAPDPGESGTEPAHSARNLARWGLPAPIGFICLANGVGLLPLSYTVHVTARAALLTLAAISVTVWITALLRCLASLAKRIPDQQLAGRTERLRCVLRWWLSIFLGIMILASTPLPMAVAARSTVTAGIVRSVFGTTGLVSGCVVLLLLARLASIMVQYRRGFRGCRGFGPLPLQGGDQRSDTARR